jgi:hypothetical protein
MKLHFERGIRGKLYAYDVEIPDCLEFDRNYKGWLQREANDNFDKIERGLNRLEQVILERYKWWSPQLTRQQVYRLTI